MKRNISTSVPVAAIASVATLMLFSSQGNAASSFSITSDPLDATVRSNGTDPNTIVDTGNFAGRIGEFFAPDAISLVLPFQLPTLGAGEVVTSANLRTQLFNKADPGNLGNADLYGLGFRTTADVLISDFYTGSTPDNTDATVIMQGFLTPATPLRIDGNNGFVETDTAADSALVGYLNAAYTGGAVAGDFVFLRLSYAVDQPIPVGNSAYELLTRNAGGANEQPLLTIDSAVVPEPSTSLLIGVAGTLALIRRRKG